MVQIVDKDIDQRHSDIVVGFVDDNLVEYIVAVDSRRFEDLQVYQFVFPADRVDLGVVLFGERYHSEIDQVVSRRSDDHRRLFDIGCDQF